MSIRVTITLEYEADPVHYGLPEDVPQDVLADLDSEAFLDGTYSVEDLLAWSNGVAVEFEAAA